MGFSIPKQWDWASFFSVTITLVQREVCVWSRVPFSWAAESHHFPWEQNNGINTEKRNSLKFFLKIFAYCALVHWLPCKQGLSKVLFSQSIVFPAEFFFKMLFKKMASG